MGIAKSLKSLFKTRKKKEIDGSTSPKGKPKNPVSRNKSMRMGIYEPYRSHFPLRQNPIPMDKSSLATRAQSTDTYQVPYGAYNPSRAKLVTANGEFPSSNYEYMDPLKRNQTMYASNESLQSGIQNIYQQHMPMRNSQLRSSTRSLDQFSQSGSVGMMKNSQHRLSMRSSVGSGSLTNVNQVAAAAANQYSPYQDWQMLNPQMPPRSNSVDPYQMMRGSNQSLNHYIAPATPNQQRHNMFQQADLHALTGLKFDQTGVPMTQNPYEIAQAVRKMEQCLQMLNSLQQQNSAKAMGQQQQQQQHPQQQKHGQQQSALKPSIRNAQAAPQSAQRSFRKTQSLQPQPEFQEREARKKRRLRKKSDLSKFDLSDLRKKLEVIDREDSTDSGGDSHNDKGYCEGSDASSDGQRSPDKPSTDNSGDDSGESSDSGVQTPPPPNAEKTTPQDFKPILSMTKGILKRSNSQ